jgi:HK97 family phage major capsid protein
MANKKDNVLQLWLKKGAVPREMREWLTTRGHVTSEATDEEVKRKAIHAFCADQMSADQLKTFFKLSVKQRKAELIEQLNQTNGDTNMADKVNLDTIHKAADANGKGGPHIRVKDASESYLNTKSVGKHTKMGVPVRDQHDQEVMLPSELEYAKAGAFFKKLAKRAGVSLYMNEHEESLFNEMVEKDTWVGNVGSQWDTNITGLRVKSLINDATSGGIEINPAWFDTNLVSFPLLSGELLPMVTFRDVPRAASVESASIGNPTMTWGINDATNIPQFNTAGIVSEINTTIHTVTCRLEVGRDFLSDAVADVGRQLTENVGARLAEEFDRVIAVGSGSSEPEGIFTASSLGSVNSDNGTSGPPTIDDYEALLFGVPKQYRNGRCCFVGADLSYQRARGISVSDTDQRRVFGMDHESYVLLGRPYKINNSIPANKIAFGDLGRYRFYRRLGMQVEWHTQGEELARRNMAMLIVRARVGGRVMDPNAFAVTTDAQL